jgi:purine-binding chemotaxis protein CheW
MPPEVQLVVFKLGNEEFGAAITSILEISRVGEITKIPEAPGFVEGAINLRGRVIAVINLARQFGLSSTGFAGAERKTRIVVTDVGGETVGLLVDEVPEILKLREDEIEPPPELLQEKIGKNYIKGMAKRGERVIVVLDLNEILRR